MASLQRLICAIRGHEDYLQFEPGRMYLQCVACGYESPGWAIENRRPALQFSTRHRPAPMTLKRVA